MKCPAMAELPPPPPGKTGWPWTEDGVPSSVSLAAGFVWPRISIVTPSFNQGCFIEETIRSVLLQGCPDLEYIVIDGGSTDDSVAVIRKYAPWISYWVSEKDRGQSHALNKGLERVTGPVFGWLNSDDFYLPGALARAVDLRARHPSAVGWAGATQVIDAAGKPTYILDTKVGGATDLAEWAHKAFIPQPSCLFSAEHVRRTGGLNEKLHYTMDIELLIKLAGFGEFAAMPDVITCFRLYAGSKTGEESPGSLVEMVATDFNLGMRKAAEHLLRHRMAGATGLAMDRLSMASRCQ